MNERGSTILMVTLSMTALLSIVALAVDVGMLYDVRTEAQRTADAAALAGASSLILRPDDEDSARALAIEYGGRNLVYGDSARVLPEDVEVDLDRARVTVTVHRTQDRGSAIPTWFANVFGVGLADVGALAAAEVTPAGSAVCVKPFAVPDVFLDVDGDGVFDPGTDQYEPAENGYGSSWRDPGQPGDDGLGYEKDFGRPIVLKGGGPNGSGGSGGGNGKKGGGSGGGGSTGGSTTYPNTGPSWYYPWDIPQIDGGPATGADRYRWNIANCNPSPVSVGEEYMVENGTMQGPTVQGAEELIGRDPWAVWDDLTNQVVNSDWSPWEGTPRIAVVPVFHPGRPFESGKKPIQFTNFIAVFMESVEGNGNDQVVVGRVLHPRGIGGSETTAPAARFVRLVR